MALIPGTNSYVTLAEADNYVAAIYHSGEVATGWQALTEAQKEAALLTACMDLSSLPFPGRAATKQQPLPFPRFPGSTVPEAIKSAQIEIALLPLQSAFATMAAEAGQRAALQRQGVKSFSLGDLSESYAGVAGLTAVYPFLLSEKVSRLLNRYIHGGYATC